VLHPRVAVVRAAVARRVALELVFVGITIIVSLAIMVAFGAWWQR